jgi:hypothetical protein
MLCLSWPITIRGHIIANKFKSEWKDEAFLETQGQAIRLAHLKLTLHVLEYNINGRPVADNVIDNDSRVCIVAYSDTY